MPERSNRTWVGITAGALGLAAVGGLAWKFTGTPRPAPGAAAGGSGTAAVGADTPLAARAAAVRQADGMAVAVLQQRAVTPDGQPVPAILESESADWHAAVAGLRAAFPKLSGYGRASAAMTAARILGRYGVEPAPADWTTSLTPVHEILGAALGDPDEGVRATAVAEIGRFWTWSPGVDETPRQLDALAAWKESLHADVVKSLGDASPKVRANAVAVLAALPLDVKAEPAVAYLADPDVDVRLTVIRGFAKRPTLLDEERLLPLLYDPMPGVGATAEAVLTERGLSSGQIGLGKMVFHPNAAMRASAVELIGQHAEIDPVVWLVFLSRDQDETVRGRAVKALIGRDSDEARARLAEMATSDPSPAIRSAAAAVTPAETTAALPPLPGSSRLNPKAN